MLMDTTADMPVCDLDKRFVRVISRHPNGLVEFTFSIAWQELNVELLLPEAAFEEFCRTNRVSFLED